MVRIDQPRRVLGEAAARLAGDPSARFTLVGVTGTNGKTTTTYLLEAIWRAAGFRPGVVGTIAYRFGATTRSASLTTPDAPSLQGLFAAMATAGTTHVAMEVSSHALAQDRVAGARFDAAVFTNLTRDHLDFHGDLERYYAAKARLFLEYLPRGGKPDPVAIVNLDDPAGERLLGCLATRAIAVGRSPRADVRPLEIETSQFVLDSYVEGRVVVQFIRVLQQIAIGYLLAFFVIHLGPLVQFSTAILLLAGHGSASPAGSSVHRTSRTSSWRLARHGRSASTAR